MNPVASPYSAPGNGVAAVQPTALRIALLTYSTKPRGSVIHTLELAEALHELGHHVCVYALDKDGKGFDRCLSCPVELVPARSAPAELDALIQQRIQEFVEYLSQSTLSYDIYHAQDCLSANALAVLRQQQKIAHFIRTVHHIEDYSSPYLQHCQDRSIREADACLCVSEQGQIELQQHYQIQAPRVINGVNTTRFLSVADDRDQRIKSWLGLHGTPIYLTIGGIEPRKNSILLLQAFAHVLKDYPNAQLVIAGGSTLFDYQNYRNEFFAVAKQLDIDVNTSLNLTGVIPDEELPALYRAADAFVFPSVKEGWGLVILEAIAAGLPVITSDQPPFTEFLTHTQALLVNPNSADAIADAMLSIVEPTLAQSLVQHSQSILSRYSWHASAQMHVQHYYQVIHHR